MARLVFSTVRPGHCAFIRTRKDALTVLRLRIVQSSRRFGRLQPSQSIECYKQTKAPLKGHFSGHSPEPKVFAIGLKNAREEALFWQESKGLQLI
ncbi:hypothetical protein ACFWXH_15880 [Mesorhizobium sp. NPDC059054]|uniref:hypothetical protein n=1 Tax=Mesorhizobium sp. NPDC059054 TaxID=3346711 RepID=UPI003682562C